MHRLLFALAALLIAPGVFAQSYPIGKGSYLLGTTASFTSQGTTLALDGQTVEESDRLSQASYGVSYGYFVIPNFAIGVDSEYQREKQGDLKQTRASIGPSLYLFIGQPTSKFYPFVSASVGYSTLTVDFDGAEGSISGFRYGAAGGLTYMLARNVGLSGSLFYRKQSYTDDDFEETTDAFGFQGGVTAFIF